jgi:hypothetical protein
VTVIVGEAPAGEVGQPDQQPGVVLENLRLNPTNGGLHAIRIWIPVS